MRQSKLRARKPAPTPQPASSVANAATMPSDQDLRVAPTRALQPRRGPRIALLVALTVAVAAGSFGIVALLTHKAGTTPPPSADATAIDVPPKVADVLPQDAAPDAPPDAQPDAHPDARPVDARPRDTQIKDASVPPTPVGYGTLSVYQNPPVAVFLDDTSLGDTPVNPIKVPAGRHRLRRYNPDQHFDKTTSIEIVADKPTKLDYTTTPP